MDIKCSVFIAASVDGFIARADGDIEWLHRPEYECPVLNGRNWRRAGSSTCTLMAVRPFKGFSRRG